MAATSYASARILFATLAVAGLILVGAWLAWRMPDRPSPSPTIAAQPLPQPIAPSPAIVREPPRAAMPESRAESPPKIGEAEPRDAREAEHLAFVRRMNTGDARRILGPGIPLVVSELVGAGRLREAADELLQMGRDGDANGYHALEQLLQSCPGPGDDRASERRALDRKSRNQQMINRMASAGASDALLDRLQWSLDAGNAFFRGIWAEFCPSRDMGDYRSLLEEAHRVVPPATSSKYEEQIRTAASKGMRPPRDVAEGHRRETMDNTRRRAEAGVIASQLQLARRDLLAGDPAQKAAAFAMLRGLASMSPDAPAWLAGCARYRCTPEAGDLEHARQLALEGARAGSVDALEMLESRLSPLIEDAAGRYAWSQVRHELHEQGCFGFSRFSMWAFRHALRRDAALREMSPHDAELAKRRATEMISTEIPAIRARLGCD
jgi:hypothetical protein